MFETSVPNPRLLVSAKNSTETTVSSMSRAKAKIGMSSGAWKIAPFGGLVMRTTGGRLDIEPCTPICTGSETDVCVLATVLDAVDRGLRVIVVEDGLCSSSDAGHDALMTIYRTRFTEQIELLKLEDVLSLWNER